MKAELTKNIRRWGLLAGCAALALGTAVMAQETTPNVVAVANPASTTIMVDAPAPVPAWALAQRAVIAANAEGVKTFLDAFVDGRGYLRGLAHYGITDGADDAMEPIRNWPIAHAVGGDEAIIEAWSHVWENHLDQYSRARVPEVEAVSEGVYYREFMPQFDWEHISEGMAGFYFYGLSRPYDRRYETRLRRYAGFYMNEDPSAPNYDPEHKIIRSLFNGSRGPRLTPPNATDWDGPEIPGGEPGRRTRFLKSENIFGDHPLNLNTVQLAFHAYLVTGEDKYRNWALEYVDAWRGRIDQNGGNIPSNIGRDGTIGGEWGGKWYGGVFGWNSPDEGVRNYVFRGPPEAFGDALLLTGDQAYTGVIRRQLDNLYAQRRVVDGKVQVPHYYGDQGWYGFYDVDGRSPGLGNRRRVEADVYMWGLEARDLARLPKTGWIGFLQGQAKDYPVQAFQAALEEIRVAAQRIRDDDTTLQYPVGITRWERSNPVATEALVNLTMGGADPGGSGHGPMPLHTQVRHFDPDARRAGLPPDVAALVEKIEPGSVVLTLVNTSPLTTRTVTVQLGGYGEHRCTSIRTRSGTVGCDGRAFSVRLTPGSSETLTIGIDRYAYRPTLDFPWDQGAPATN
ncbi:MAG: hypothetical protein LKF80_04350 [Brevundimonas sp.]|jgi:hypothetical protein|uniref:hypothetical protein n=1 Tax=Brevundimonas sp. TaxID=1871086 RepID=UPI0025C16253|nr:hypothetical protein [Brevundimonas sp.]MCH4267613.1 hypothetical protein [Brevundimonas sp.]